MPTSRSSASGSPSQLLFESSRPDPTARRPLFTDFAPRLLVSHPSEVKIAHAPLLALLTELMEEADAAGQLRDGINPKRMAAMTMQTVMFNAAQSNGEIEDGVGAPHQRRRTVGLLFARIRRQLALRTRFSATRI